MKCMHKTKDRDKIIMFICLFQITNGHLGKESRVASHCQQVSCQKKEKKKKKKSDKWGNMF